MRTIEEQAIHHAARVLIEEWNRDYWCENLEAKLEDLAAMIASERKVELGRLLEIARRMDPFVGKHYKNVLR